jgi:DNA-binding MarR family transcriptional regulator
MSNNPDEHLIDLLFRRFAELEANLSARLAAGGWHQLTRPQIMLFAYLHGPGSRASDIARHMRISRQAVHQMVKSLEADGLLRQIPDPEQGNAKLIIKTDAGYQLNDIARKYLREIDNGVQAAVGKEQMAELRKILLSNWAHPPERREGVEKPKLS